MIDAILFGIAGRFDWRAALVPALIIACLLVVRTWFEDRMLKAELAGYTEYARDVRQRLVPGLW